MCKLTNLISYNVTRITLSLNLLNKYTFHVAVIFQKIVLYVYKIMYIENNGKGRKNMSSNGEINEIGLVQNRICEC